MLKEYANDVQKSVQYKSVVSCGLNILHIISYQKSQKIMWLKRFLQDQNSTWAQVANNFFNEYRSLIFLMINCNYDFKILNKNILVYYKFMLLN